MKYIQEWGSKAECDVKEANMRNAIITHFSFLFHFKLFNNLNYIFELENILASFSMIK